MWMVSVKFTPSITVTTSVNYRGALKHLTKMLYYVSTECLNSAISPGSCYFHNFVWKKSPLHGRMSTSFPSLYWFWRLSTQVCFQAFWEGAPNTRNLTPEDSRPAVRENKQKRKVIYWQVQWISRWSQGQCNLSHRHWTNTFE